MKFYFILFYFVRRQVFQHFVYSITLKHILRTDGGRLKISLGQVLSFPFFFFFPALDLKRDRQVICYRAV